MLRILLATGHWSQQSHKEIRPVPTASGIALGSTNLVQKIRIRSGNTNAMDSVNK